MTLIFKVIVILFLLSILFSLGSALYYLMRDKGESNRIVVALSWRIGLSVFLFILLILGFIFGWIQPHHIGA